MKNQYYCNKCKDKNFLVECACGKCGLARFSRDKLGRKMTFIIGHQHVGKPSHNRRVWKDKDGYLHYGGKLMHRMVWEETHNCCLLSYAIVHHIDEVKENNHPSNLQGMLKNDHPKIHKPRLKKKIIS